MPSMLNPSWVAGPGSGTAGRWLMRNTVAVVVQSSKGVIGRGEGPAVAAHTGAYVNRRHARWSCKAKWSGQWYWRCDLAFGKGRCQKGQATPL